MGGKAGVCLRDEEVEDLQFRGPVTKKNCSDGAGRLMAWGSAEMQGWRESMEDAHLVLPYLREAVLSENCKLEVDAGWENIGLFGVMDGHGGFQVARFCERHLPEAIAARSSTDPAVAMAKSFVEMDELLQEPEGLKELRRLSALAKSARARRQTAEGMGCTVVLSCITPNALIVANAGDSRAVLCRNGQAVDLSKDHKPELPCERSRIESAGGWVEGGSVLRVNGDLSLSRAVGDLEYKLNPQLPPERQIVTSSPDVRVVPRQPQDEFLMLACDGERDMWGELVTQKFGLPVHLYDCYIPLERSPPMAGTAPNNSQKCLKNDIGEPKLDVICYAANYYPHRSCLAGQDIVVESRRFVTLEEQLRGWPKLSVHLKIDVEGSEWDVLEWLTYNPAEWDKVRTLDMEIHFGFGSAAELPQYKALSLQEKLTRQVSIMEALRKRFFCTGSTLEVYRQGWSPQDNCGVSPCGEPPVYLPNGFSVTAFAVSYVHKELVDVRLD